MNEQEQPLDLENTHAIVVTFDGLNSANFGIRLFGQISAEQMLMIAAKLDFEAKYMLNLMKNKAIRDAMEEESTPKIAVPSSPNVDLSKIK